MKEEIKMMMFNKTTKQHGEWVTIEGLEFLELDSGNFVHKDNVGSDWIEIDDQTTKMLLDLADAVVRKDDISFLLLEHIDEGVQMLGHNLSDRMILNLILTMIEHFTEGDPIKTVMLMMAIKEAIMEDEDE